jgi:hypothetical protein
MKCAQEIEKPRSSGPQRGTVWTDKDAADRGHHYAIVKLQVKRGAPLLHLRVVIAGLHRQLVLDAEEVIGKTSYRVTRFIATPSCCFFFSRFEGC